MRQGNVKRWKGRSHLTAMLSEDDGATGPTHYYWMNEMKSLIPMQKKPTTDTSM